MARETITEEDEGKTIVNADEEKVGIVTGVRGGTAYVDPDPGLTESITSKLGWEDVDTEDYPLEADRVEEVTDDEIRLTRDL